MSRELYIGLMSGTSLDGVDAALVGFEASHISLLGCHFQPLPPELKQAILQLNTPGRHNELHESCILDRQLGHFFAHCVQNLLKSCQLDGSEIIAIGSHGQTLRHTPKQPSAELGYTLQIGDPNTIAQTTGITTVADFRRKDIAAGGQGAPLVPAFHRAAFHNPSSTRLIVNIGGMANITLLPADRANVITGYDTGPGNCLMDAWIQRHLGQNHDDGGRWAARGKTHPALLKKLLSHPYFAASPPKSTGRETFNLPWVEAALAALGAPPIAPEDVQATLTELTAKTIADELSRVSDGDIFVCGGGSHNAYLIDRLSTLCGKPIESTNVLGVHPDWVEAMAFAWLARQTLNRQPGACREVTGAKKDEILGGVYWV